MSKTRNSARCRVMGLALAGALVASAIAAPAALTQDPGRDAFKEAFESVSRGRNEDALRIAAELLGEPGGKPRSMAIEGLISYYAGRFEDARNSFESARAFMEDGDPFASKLLEYCAMACTALSSDAARGGRFEEGLELADRALSRDGDYGPAYNARGYILEVLGRQQEALRAYEAAEKRLADPSQAILRAGFLKVWINDYKGATEKFEKYLASPGAQAGGRAQAHLNLGRIAMDRWNLGRARRHFAWALEADAGLGEARALLARVEKDIRGVKRTVRFENRLMLISAGLIVLYLAGGAAAWFRLRPGKFRP